MPSTPKSRQMLVRLLTLLLRQAGLLLAGGFLLVLGWLVSTKVGGVALVMLINWGTQVVAGETAFALVWGYIWENPTGT